MAMGVGGVAGNIPKGAIASNAVRRGGNKTADLTDAQLDAQKILDMRAEGKASSVPDSLFATADPKYLYDNYPLPMDQASRMQRAKELGYDVDNPYRHSTPNDFQAFDTQKVDVGTHIGSAEQAENRFNHLFNNSGQNFQTHGLLSKAGNRPSYEMPDVGLWNNASVVYNNFEQRRMGNDANLDDKIFGNVDQSLHADEYIGSGDYVKSPENREMLNQINEQFQDAGYGSIKYLNEAETMYKGKGRMDPEISKRIDANEDEIQSIISGARDRYVSERPKMPDASDPDAEAKLKAYFDYNESNPYDPLKQQTPEETIRIAQLKRENSSLDVPENRQSPYSTIVLDPADLRSTNARFDPEFADSADLLSANRSKTGGLLAAGMGDDINMAPNSIRGNVIKGLTEDQKAQRKIDSAAKSAATREAVARQQAGEQSGISFDEYLNKVNPDNKYIPEENRPNLQMGDMYGMLPKDAELLSEFGEASIYRGGDGNFFATAHNKDLGEQDVVGYISKGNNETDLMVVDQMQGKGIGSELQRYYRSENPYAPTGGLTEAGKASLEKTYKRLLDDGIISANNSKTGGLLAAGMGRKDPSKANKRELDPYGFQKSRLTTGQYLDDTELRYNDYGRLLPRVEKSWEDMLGKYTIPFFGDRTRGGAELLGINDIDFKLPVFLEGGTDFMRYLANQRERAIWASKRGRISTIDNKVNEAAKRLGTDEIYGVTGSMAPDASDFATFTGEALAELVGQSPITKKFAKEYDRNAKGIVDESFVGLLSPDLRNWAKNADPEARKRFIRSFDTAPNLAAGLPNPALARWGVNALDQRNIESGMFGLGASKIDIDAPQLYNFPKQGTNEYRAAHPHGTYDTQLTGDYFGTLPPIPQEILYSDAINKMLETLDKNGNIKGKANLTHGLKTQLPVEQVTQQKLDRIMEYLARKGK